MLDDLAAFQQTLFSSPAVESLALAILSGTSPFPDPDPKLNELELQGKVVFNRACGQCHGGPLNPSTSTPDATLVRPPSRYHPIFTAFPRPASDFPAGPPRLERNARRYQITLANGAVTNITTSDPGRLLLTGQLADLGLMDVPNLRGISRTAPYFHNNSAATLEEMLDHYDVLFARVARLIPAPNRPPFLSSNGVDWDRGFVSPDERAALLAYRESYRSRHTDLKRVRHGPGEPTCRQLEKVPPVRWSTGKFLSSADSSRETHHPFRQSLCRRLDAADQHLVNPSPTFSPTLCLRGGRSEWSNLCHWRRCGCLQPWQKRVHCERM